VQAKNDPDAKLLQDAADTSNFGADCEVRTFFDQSHGFCAARGDWTQPKIKRGAYHAISMAIDFYAAVVKV
jgi:protein XRP2